MSIATPRLRMFAGPNGSGKSTLKSVLPAALLGIYINPDEIEKEMRAHRRVDLKAYEVGKDANSVLKFFKDSTFLQGVGMRDMAGMLTFAEGKLCLPDGSGNAYLASVVSDFIRQSLIEQKMTFTFETVMSSSDKIALLEHARRSGYRTYLYYIATDDPAINISRVRHRVRQGGHDVPEDKLSAVITAP